MTASSDTEASDSPIEPVDWEALSGSDRTVPWRLVGFVLSLVALAWLYQYTASRNAGVLLSWRPRRLTWAYRVGLLVVVFFGLPPLLRNRERTRRYWRRLRRKPAALAALAYTVAFTLIAIVGPYVVGRPQVNLQAASQPPVFVTSRTGTVTLDCVGPVVRRGGEAYCKGTMAYPLGTNDLGQTMVDLLVSGMHVSLQVAVITAALMIPIATTVGVVSGYRGGWVDTLLMRYVDIQQAVPPFVVYLILVYVFRPNLFLFVAVFGLLSWGSIARLVRSEVLTIREEPYVEAAENAGVGQLTILRRHVLPNVSNTVLVGTTQQIPRLILLEAALTFIELGDVGRFFQSFGATIAEGFGTSSPREFWWVWLFPTVVLAMTAVAFAVLGDALRDVLDPRGDL